MQPRIRETLHVPQMHMGINHLGISKIIFIGWHIAEPFRIPSSTNKKVTVMPNLPNLTYVTFNRRKSQIKIL
jgi:hypothetical protein